MHCDEEEVSPPHAPAGRPGFEGGGVTTRSEKPHVQWAGARHSSRSHSAFGSPRPLLAVPPRLLGSAGLRVDPSARPTDGLRCLHALDHHIRASAGDRRGRARSGELSPPGGEPSLVRLWAGNPAECLWGQGQAVQPCCPQLFALS